MGERCIADECLSSTGFNYTLSLISGKYKMTILYTLMEFGDAAHSCPCIIFHFCLLITIHLLLSLAGRFRAARR